MKLPLELSERISMLRLPLIVGVVFLHTYDTAIGRSVSLEYTGWVKFVFNYISEGLATLSVPLFFLLAGYLFFYGGETSTAWFYSKIAKRVKTLLVPLVVWNLLCLLLVAMAQANPATAQFFSGRSAPLATFSWMDYVNAILGVTTHPIAYQFWFIRDLIVLAILSPLIFFLLKHAAAPFLLLLALRWFSASTAWTIPFLTREAALFFCVGSLLAIREVDLRRVDRWSALLLVYVPLSIFDALAKGTSVSNPIHKTAELFGIAFVFSLTRYFWQSARSRNALIALSSASFFVFASHEPLLTVARKLSYRILPPSNDLSLVLLYFANPVLVVVLGVTAYFLCVKTMPLFTSVITGGRLAQRAEQAS